jgi:hypothetical protein
VTAKYKFCLYVAGDSALSAPAARNLSAFCEEFAPGEHEITVVDILTRPGLARAKKILACPLLVRERPGPELRVTGDLSDALKLSDIVGLGETEHAPIRIETSEESSR